MSFMMQISSKFINYKVLGVLLVSLFGLSCSEQTSTDKTEDVAQKQKLAAGQKPPVEIIIDPLPTKQIRGDYQNVQFIIENAAKKKFYEGTLDCSAQNIDSDPTQEVVCSSMQKPEQLHSGTYRILLKSVSGHGLTCDVFEYKAGTPLHLVLNEETSGECLLWQMVAETGYSEQEIKKRVAHILNAEGTENYDLEATLFDLYMYFGGKNQHKNAWYKLLELVKSNQPLPKNNDSTINSSLKML